MTEVTGGTFGKLIHRSRLRVQSRFHHRISAKGWQQCTSGMTQLIPQIQGELSWQKFQKWVRENYPDTIIVGPCTCDADAMRGSDENAFGGAGIADVMKSVTTSRVNGRLYGNAGRIQLSLL